MKIAAYIITLYKSDIESVKNNHAEDGMKALKGLKGSEAFRSWVQYRHNYYGKAWFDFFDGKFTTEAVNTAREAGYIVPVGGRQAGTFGITEKGFNAIYKACKLKSWVI